MPLIHLLKKIDVFFLYDSKGLELGRSVELTLDLQAVIGT